MKQTAKTITIAGLIVFLFELHAFTQPPAKIILKKQYYGTLDQVLDRISLENKVLFTFNKRKLALIQVDDNTVNQSLDKLLDKWCLKSKMEWYQNADNIINIVGRNRTPFEAAAKPESAKTYSGKAQNFNILISGKIVDSGTGEAVPYATISIPGTNKGANSNQDGYYTLQNVPTDTTTIVVSSIGYKTGYIFLTPEMAKSKLDVQIEPANIEMAEVVVSAQKNTVMITNTKAC